ncbi:MAG: tRNA pseudouridine synthase A, partial [bacterium]
MLVQYDGTDFHGFQKQPGGVRTVQGELENALSNLLGEQVEIIGASRTDAGVHAFGQVVNFILHTQTSLGVAQTSLGVHGKSRREIPPDKIAYAIRRFLPPDISVVSSEEVAQDFHARFNAKAKVYVYVCYRSHQAIPFLRRNALEVNPDVRADKMHEAAQYFLGTHDFSSFRNESDAAADPVR